MKKVKLQIALTADPEVPVPPFHYGGIERIVSMLAAGLIERGHDVYLFANPDSKTPAHLIPYRGKRSRSLLDTMINARQIKRFLNSSDVDIVHSFSRLAYLLPILNSPTPKVQSYQRPVARRSVYWGIRLSRGTLSFTACSRYCAETASFVGGHWYVIPNGIPLAKYEFNPKVSADAPLVFLGRIERIKGTHTAIKVAKEAGKKLIIAGNHDTRGENHKYFTKEVLPHCNGKDAEYAGPVDDIQKNRLLRNACALLFPVEWGEPFGIVMVEALACGTPVIAFIRGAVAEVVQDGINGFACRTEGDMKEAINGIESIDRRACRKTVEDRFSDKIIVEAYLALYESLIANRDNSVPGKALNVIV